MKRSIQVLLSITILCSSPFVAAKDAIYSLKEKAPSEVKVDGTDLVVRMPLEEIAVPKAKRITLNEAKGSYEGDYIVQIDLAAATPENFRPIIVLGEHTLMERVLVGGSDEVGYTITLGSNDITIARDLLKRLQALFKLDAARVDDYTLVSQSKTKK